MTTRHPNFSIRARALFLALPILVPYALAQLPLPTLTYYSFGQSEYGLYPAAGVIAGNAGELYGTTGESGSFTNCYEGCGTVFMAIPPSTPSGTWTESAIYTFQGGAQDGSAGGGLLMDKSGTIYGVTATGGPGSCGAFPFDTGCGTIYSLTPPSQAGGAWTERVLYTFTGGADGNAPSAPMVIGKDRVLYGTATYGGATSVCISSFVPNHGCGTVFSLTPPQTPGNAWTFGVIYTFKNFGDGAGPGNLVMGPNGILYGNTASGGSAGVGTIYSLRPPSSAGGAWTKTLVYAFHGGIDGANPQGVIIGEAPGGGGAALYGGTNNGGNQDQCGMGKPGCGTAYMLTPPGEPGQQWTETIISNFPGVDGFFPAGNLAMGAGGILFGVTAGALNNGGSAYALIPPTVAGGTWQKQVLYGFPCCGPLAPSNIMLRGFSLYGTAGGGLLNGGTIWALAWMQ